jgi:hypothetical protein
LDIFKRKDSCLRTQGGCAAAAQGSCSCSVLNAFHRMNTSAVTKMDVRCSPQGNEKSNSGGLFF